MSFAERYPNIFGFLKVAVIATIFFAGGYWRGWSHGLDDGLEIRRPAVEAFVHEHFCETAPDCLKPEYRIKCPTRRSPSHE